MGRLRKKPRNGIPKRKISVNHRNKSATANYASCEGQDGLASVVMGFQLCVPGLEENKKLKAKACKFPREGLVCRSTVQHTVGAERAGTRAEWAQCLSRENASDRLGASRSSVVGHITSSARPTRESYRVERLKNHAAANATGTITC